MLHIQVTYRSYILGCFTVVCVGASHYLDDKPKATKDKDGVTCKIIVIISFWQP